MDAVHVNWEALDALVLDFARYERLILSPSGEPSPPASPSAAAGAGDSYKSRLLIRRVRRAVESGDLDAAISLLRDAAPAVLDDHRLLFRLHMQRFVELLRSGGEKGRDAAIECLRSALAPCALDAYPEAYGEFKHVILALIYDKDDQSSPVASEWSEKKRSILAGLVSSVLRVHLHAYDPVFSMTLRYLISIHKIYCSRQGIQSSVSDLTERLLFEDRDPRAIPHESSLDSPPFDEADIQALAHAVELTRQGSIDSLKLAKGDLYHAFQDELCRMKLDLSVLDNLVHEYCMYRGIVGSSSKSTSGALDSACAQKGNLESVRIPEHPVDLRSPSEDSHEIEDCSTSEISNQEFCYKKLRKIRHHSSEERRRKRWRGRIEVLECASDGSVAVTSGTDLMEVDTHKIACREQELKNSGNISDESHKYELILGMRELAYKGMANTVVDEIKDIDPGFFAENPVLLFELKQVEFLKLVSIGDCAAAIKVACSYLGPLAANHQQLLKPLKETLVNMIHPDDDGFFKSVSLPNLATSLQIAMSKRFGIEEPQLMKIMRATLHTHTEWFKLQMCKDCFEQYLKIDALKSVDVPLRGDAFSKSLSDECGTGSSHISTCSSGKLFEDGSSPPLSSSEASCDENSILKVMEFLGLPRSDAIHLLMQYNGNAENVIQQMFA